MRRFGLLVTGFIAALALVGCAGGDDEAVTATTTSKTTTEARWVIADLGTLGGKESYADAINNRGQIVGSSATKNGATHAFLWESGKMTDLGTLPGRVTSEAVAINDRGQIVGNASSLSSYGDHIRPRAVLWEKGEMRYLGTLGGEWSEAVAINERGQVIGQSETKSGYTHAFLWQNGKMIDLGSLNRRHQGQVCPVGSQYEESEPGAINEQGQVVGWATTDYRDKNGCLTPHAFVWQDGKMRDLGTLPGRENPNYPKSSYAYDINERGRIVGQSSMGYGSPHAFLWQNGKMTDLGTLAKDRLDRRIASEAVAINDRGQIIGESENGVGERHTVLWQQGRIIPLDKRGYFSANAINERGQILGVGDTGEEDKDGYSILRAFLWQNGKLTDLGALPGGERSFPGAAPYYLENARGRFALNDRGQVIGYSDSEERCKDEYEVFACDHAVLWTLKRG